MIRITAFIVIVSTTCTLPIANAQVTLGSEWNYDGKLDLLGSRLNGTADFEFSLYDDPNGGAQIGSTVAVNSVTVTDGLFTAEIDFGVPAFNGDKRWLEIAVRSPAGSGVFTTLFPSLKILVLFLRSLRARM